MVLRVVQTMQKLFVSGAFVIGAFGDLARQRGDFRLQPQHLIEGFGRLFGQRRGVGHAHRLRQIADRTFAVQGHMARRGLLFARDDAQQRGFPAPLRPTRPMRSFGLIRNEILSKRVQPP